MVEKTDEEKEMDVDIGKKIRHLRHRRGWTLRELGDAIGKTAAYLSIIENKYRHVRRPILDDVARALGVDIGYFVGEEEPLPDQWQIIRELQDLVERHAGPGSDKKRPGRKVPILTDIAAGKPFSREDPFPVGIADEYIGVPVDITDKSAFGLRIKGDSMEPRLLEGDIVVICPTWEVRENKPVVAKVRDDEVTCKLYARKGEVIVLSPINPKYPPQFYTEKEIVWIYPVARAISNLYT